MDDVNIQNIIGRLESVYADLTTAIRSARKAEKIAAEKDFFTHPWKLKRPFRAIIGKKYVSVEELMSEWTEKWKAEGRLSANGLRIRLGKKEAKLLGLEPEKTVSVYEVSSKCMDLFDV